MVREKTNISFHTELGLTRAYDYKDTAPTALAGEHGVRLQGSKVKGPEASLRSRPVPFQ
jgi:hypothetical protein